MGAWGHLAFENDDACDWACDLEDVADLSLVEEALGAVEEADDYLEAPEAAMAIGACELLARLRGSHGYQNDDTKKVDAWVREHPMQPSPQMLARATAVIDRILGDDSELRQLWEEADDSEWVACVEDLRSRLGT
jgi:hypothetical protein